MLEVGEQVEKYVVEALLGQGGMAQVWRVRHAVLGSTHALKVLLPELVRDEALRQRFLAEGQIQARLRHPNIVAVTDVVTAPGVAGLVMDHVEGDTLETVRARLKGPPDPAFVREVFGQILAAVGYAHAHGVVHRDLKPANVLLSPRDGGGVRAVVVDFGIAKVLVDEPAARGTAFGARMGTLHYMSPEQVRGARDVTARSDVFSLGVTLYEFVTGTVPFDGPSDYDVQHAIVQGRYVRPAERVKGIDPRIAQAIERALQSDPAARFGDCDEFARALDAGSPRAGGASAKASSGRGRTAAVAGGLVVVLAGGGGAYWWMTHDPRAEVLAQARSLSSLQRFCEARAEYEALATAGHSLTDVQAEREQAASECAGQEHLARMRAAADPAAVVALGLGAAQGSRAEGDARVLLDTAAAQQRASIVAEVAKQFATDPVRAKARARALLATYPQDAELTAIAERDVPAKAWEVRVASNDPTLAFNTLLSLIRAGFRAQVDTEAPPVTATELAYEFADAPALAAIGAASKAEQAARRQAAGLGYRVDVRLYRAPTPSPTPIPTPVPPPVAISNLTPLDRTRPAIRPLPTPVVVATPKFPNFQAYVWVGSGARSADGEKVRRAFSSLGFRSVSLTLDPSRRSTGRAVRIDYDRATQGAREAAEAAQSALLRAGIPASKIEMTSHVGGRFAGTALLVDVFDAI